MRCGEAYGGALAVPRVGEMVLMGRTPGCITRVIGAFNGHWWVETSATSRALVQAIVYNSGRTRIWAVRAYDDGAAYHCT